MTRTLLFMTMLGLALSTEAQAQSGQRGTNPQGSGGNQNIQPSLPDPRTDGPDTVPRVLYVSGKVTVEDGTPPAERVLIQSNCEGTVRTEGYTDQKGVFSFDLANTRNRALSGTAMASDTPRNATTLGNLRQNTPSDWRKCELKAILAGFSSAVVDLARQPRAFGNVDIGTIVLRRVAPVEGSIISANTAAAPPEAMKDYEKGLEEKKNSNLDAAQQCFRKALEAAPRFALAWLELGRVQIQQKDAEGARVSFRKSISADPRLMSPYQELAQLAAREKQWQEVADNTDELLKLNSTSYPEFWFYNCVSKYQLGDLDAAEKSALQGVKIDTEHRIPKMEYVLGAILIKKGDYPGATQHFHEYLRLLPNGPDAAEAQKKLEDLAKLQ